MKAMTLDPQQIYLSKMKETSERLGACGTYLAEYDRTKSVYSLESSILQLRKALESVAFAAIAPNKKAYEKLRLDAEKPADYRKDYNGKKILHLLGKVNKDFYPNPLLPAIQAGKNKIHFERKKNGFLTKHKFESIYDRLGKYLHADNPWGEDKGIKNLVADIPLALTELHSLLELHFTAIRTPDFLGLWVVKVPPNGDIPTVIAGKANEDFEVM